MAIKGSDALRKSAGSAHTPDGATHIKSHIKSHVTKRVTKQRILVICACSAICFLAVVVCLQAFLPANTPLLGVGSADPGFTCTIMIVLGAVLAVWGYTLRQRCSDYFIGKH